VSPKNTVIPNTAINNNGRAITITLAILSNKSKMGKYAKYNKKYCSAGNVYQHLNVSLVVINLFLIYNSGFIFKVGLKKTQMTLIRHIAKSVMCSIFTSLYPDLVVPDPFGYLHLYKTEIFVEFRHLL
jgi:hypothetical protein